MIYTSGHTSQPSHWLFSNSPVDYSVIRELGDRSPEADTLPSEGQTSTPRIEIEDDYIFIGGEVTSLYPEVMEANRPYTIRLFGVWCSAVKDEQGDLTFYVLDK